MRSRFHRTGELSAVGNRLAYTGKDGWGEARLNKLVS